MTTFPSVSQNRFNFPPKLDRNEAQGSDTFPSDLINNDKRNFYTQIEFVDYSPSFQFNSTPYALPSGGIKLPIPLKLDDNYVLSWSQVSLTDTLMKMAGTAGQNLQAAVGFGGVFAGQALNPLMFLQFQRPEYKQFSLSWVLTPRNAKESKAIKNIITKCKQAAAPTKGIFLLGYPQVALIRMRPDDIFGHLRFKPCVITSVQVSYNGGPTPSFHKDGAPTIISFTLNLMEMQYWYRDEIK